MNDAPDTTHDEKETLLREVKAKATDKLEAYENKIRESPEKAMLIAAAAGYCLHILPVLPILAVPVRLAAFLAKPALFALGVVKLCEIAKDQVKR
jgi:hypothetical protein